MKGFHKLTSSPIRYTEDEIKEIRQDDEYLLDQLEQLVVEFDVAYESFLSGDMAEGLGNFFDIIWRPRMERVRRRLGEEDTRCMPMDAEG